MNREKLLRHYTAFSILMGIFFFLAMLLYVSNFTGLVNGLVEKTLFNITIQNYFGDVPIPNLPLYVFVLLLVFNIPVYILLGRSEDITKQPLKEVSLMNTIFTIVLVLGQLLFILLVPEAINVEVADQFIMVDMPRTVFESVKVINLNYLVSLLYIGYNIYVIVKTNDKVEKKDKIDVELYEDTLLREFTKED